MVNKTISSSSSLRTKARRKLSENWTTGVLLYLVFIAISMIVNFIPRVGPILNFILGGPLALGLVVCFLRLIRDKPFRIENLFDGFSNFKSAFLTQLLKTIFAFLWSLLLVIPGIIAYYRYSMAFYILHDNPEIGAMEAINRSKEMMDGYKADLFLLHLSFIGWAILALFTLGIGFLWLGPYAKAAEASFYQQLKEIKNSNLEQNQSEEKEAI